MLVICVVSLVAGDVALSLVVVNVAVDALVNHLMKCKQTRCDVIPFDMTGNNNDTGVSHNLQFLSLTSILFCPLSSSSLVVPLSSPLRQLLLLFTPPPPLLRFSLL